MDDAILAHNDRAEALSRAYVAVVAAGAGYTLAAQDFDRDGVDVQIRAGGAMHPSLDLQLKATARLNRGDDGDFRYPLRRRNYGLTWFPGDDIPLDQIPDVVVHQAEFGLRQFENLRR